MQALRTSSTNQIEFLPYWEKAMRCGLMGGRPFSEHSVSTYLLYAKWFLKKYELVSIQNLKLTMLEIPPEQFAKRFKLYQALNCFAKFLIEEGQLTEDYLEQAKRYKPKRHLPPRKTTVSEPEIQLMLDKANVLLDKTLLILLSSTGLRVSEAANLRINDLDLESKVLTIQVAKWGKSRRVGLSPHLLEVLEQYLVTRQPFSGNAYLFLDKHSKPITRYGIRERIEKLGKKAGVKVTPHALRRAFVTINANKGRPLPMLQIACGHSCITTTRSYCMTTEDETIQAMQSWE